MNGQEKIVSDKTIDVITNFTREEIDKWLVDFVSVNDRKFLLTAQLQEEVMEIENKLFDQHEKLEITMGLMK